jgi:predicted nucleotidyltransferase
MLRVFRSFESEGLEYVLIGATAMGFHGLIRATEDVDLLIRATEANIDTVDAEVKDVEGIRVRIATPKALYRLKKDTVRPLDRQDAAALRERFDLSDDEEPQ